MSFTSDSKNEEKAIIDLLERISMQLDVLIKHNEAITGKEIQRMDE